MNAAAADISYLNNIHAMDVFHTLIFLANNCNCLQAEYDCH